jgi:hypothetical protein
MQMHSQTTIETQTNQIEMELAFRSTWNFVKHGVALGIPIFAAISTWMAQQSQHDYLDRPAQAGSSRKSKQHASTAELPVAPQVVQVFQAEFFTVFE